MTNPPLRGLPPDPEQANLVRQMKVPPPTTGGWVAFREFMLNFFENGVPADLTALNQHHDDLITKLTYAQLDTIAVLMNMQENFE